MKVLISSDCNGHFPTLFSKVAQLQTKNTFDILLMVGTVFTIPSSAHIPKIQSKHIKIDIPTYIIDNGQIGSIFRQKHPQGFDISNNFTFLGAYGVRKIGTIVIAFINGISYIPTTQTTNQYLGKYFTAQTVRDLIKQCQQFQTIDILLTNEWAHEYPNNEKARSSRLVSQLVYNLSPKYHIGSSGGCFYRMDPFKSLKGHATHFINVAPINSQNPTDKYLYAIKMTGQTETIKMSPNPFQKITEYSEVNNEQKIYNRSLVERSTKRNQRQTTKKYEHQEIDEKTQIHFSGFSGKAHDSEITQFLQRWGDIATIQIFPSKKNQISGIVRFRDPNSAKICISDSLKYTHYSQRIKFEVRSRNIMQDYECWFCWSSKLFDNSLVLYKGNECYVAVDKGPINQTHVQLVPLSHEFDWKQVKKQSQKQLRMIKLRMKNKYRQNGKTFICYYRCANLSTNINHYVEHCLASQLSQDLLVTQFKEMNERDSLGFYISQKQNNNLSYFARVQIGQTVFQKQLKNRQRKDILRQAVCIMLDKIPHINWKDCQLPNPHQSQQFQELKQFINDIIQLN